MSKVRINDLARELEVKSKQILDALEYMGLAEGKTHSSSIEASEAERVRGHFERGGSRPAGSGGSSSSRTEQDNKPKIDLSNISKPGDVLKAILAKKQEAERQAQFPQRPAGPPAGSPVVVRPPAGGATAQAPTAASGAPRPATPPPNRVVAAGSRQARAAQDCAAAASGSADCPSTTRRCGLDARYRHPSAHGPRYCTAACRYAVCAPCVPTRRGRRASGRHCGGQAACTFCSRGKHSHANRSSGCTTSGKAGFD